MKLTRKLIPAFIMLLVSAVLMSTASFAWFAMNTEVSATGMAVKAKADSIFLEISGPNDKTGEGESQTDVWDISGTAMTVQKDDEGKITKEQLHELISAGWTVAIFWEGIDTDDGIDTGALGEYLTEMRDALATLDLPMADTLIFDKFTYSDVYDAVLSEYGVRFATHYGDGSYQLIDKETEGDVMHPGIVGWNTDGYGNAFLIKVEKEKGVASFAVEFESGGDLGSYLDLERKDYMDAFERMLDAIEKNADRGDVSCIGFREAYINRAAYVDAWTVMMDVIGDDLATIAARVVDLEKEILEIVEKYEAILEIMKKYE